MSYESVKLWFSKDNNGNLITIDEVTDGSNTTYSCPMCGSNLIPKAIKSKQVSSHFAHVDVSKCNSETMIHWWFKNKFIESGDKFTIISDQEREYICKEVLVEKSYEVCGRVYQPDFTVLTECGRTIYFEMDYSNKKQVKDYLDIWLELKNIVVEIDIRRLMINDNIPSFEALFYDGKCFHIKKNDTYYNTVGKYKEEILREDVDSSVKERIKKLDWFWYEIQRYNDGEIDIEQVAMIIDHIDYRENWLINEIIKKSFCSKLRKDYTEYKNLDRYHTFQHEIVKDSPIVSTVKSVNKRFREVDHDYKLSLKKEKVYRGSPEFYYRINLSHPMNYQGDWFVSHLYITNRMAKNENVSDLESIIYKYFAEHRLRAKCVDCFEYYDIPFGEVRFFKEKGLNLPKRCKSCRDERKSIK